jgi:uncharacterized membrane protein YjjP (DUF1212 family)
MRTQLRVGSSTLTFPAVELKTEPTVSAPRVIDLALRTGELLLGSGEGGEDVEAAMLGVKSAYGLERSQTNVTFNSITISHQPSLVDPPVTGERVVRRRAVDFNRLDEAHLLLDDITNEDLSLEEAYHRLADIRRNRHPYSKWVVMAATGGVASSASIMVGAGPVIAAVAFLAAVAGDRLAQALATRGVPEFYQFVLAAMPAAILAAVMIKLEIGVKPYAVVTGGLFATLPGRALVAAVQDGLTGFYITAAARLLEVAYLIIGLICGISLVLYCAAQLEIDFNVEGAFDIKSNPPVQILAAAGVSLTFAILVQARQAVLPLAAAGGAISWAVCQVMIGTKAAPVLATLIASGLIGLLGQLLARVQRVSALPYIVPAIGPLLPGSALYQGLLEISHSDFDEGMRGLTTAASLALVLAIGVNLGSEVSRFVLPAPDRNLRESRAAAKRTRGF